MSRNETRTLRGSLGALLLASALVVGVLFLRSSMAATATWTQGPGTVPEDVRDEALGWTGLYGVTDAVLLEGATTVGALRTLQPHIADAVFQQDTPTTPVYVIFAEGQYRQEHPGEPPFKGELAMLVLDAKGVVRASTFYRLGQEPVITSDTRAFDRGFDIETLLPQSG